ncbi:MAG: carboxypeptidase [Cytophagales bacterium]|jgi:carboxypeptidase C (cathepsin A)|nr:carboxypeptidase [Cytophagales bacterium]MCA6386655.1 carboxypeptidase [Cytophagales bacterium]MCA6392410.1 carboxypeptidase [Cytophagales bacterium]MCA6394150.1 carboxypeptidase [Cytophagales bacterium]MCA6400382.1 carboxypeptidase [Cytophagales bacterium]
MKSLLTTLSIFVYVCSLAQERVLPAESAVNSTGQVTIKGKVVPYKVTAGTQPVWNAEGKPSASLFYTYYERSDVSDKSRRPLIISFNGGPGSASVWMHVAYTGPKVLNIDSEGFPVQPYGIHDNPHSILDVADIVYVDPVNTGFSRILDPKAEKTTFFGVNADIKYLGDWVDNFVSRQGRWTSPKYLIGESYGTTRVSGLALDLQNNHWMYLNGVILVSPTELGIKRDGPVNDALSLPYYTAAAWYQKALPADLQQKDLMDVLAESEAFTINEFIPALSRGGFLEEAKKKQLAASVSRYSGLSERTVMQHNLAVPTQYFWKDLLREKGFTVGRLDSRYLGIDRQQAGEQPDYNSELTSWLHSFTPAINYYLRDVLKYKTDLQYNMFGPVRPWDNSNDKTGENLRQAMAENPYMHVMIQSGYYDGATTYFDAKYSMWQLDPSGKMKDRLRFEGYRSGHMMYLRAEDLATSNEHIRDFIRKSTPTGSAKY